MSDSLNPSFITVDGAGRIGAIFPGTIVAGNIKVGNLSEISPNLGTVTAGILEGATVRTAAKGARVEEDAAGLRAYNGAGEEVLSFSTETGNLLVKGTIQAQPGSTIPATAVTGQLTDAQLKEIAAAKLTGTIVGTQVGPEAISTPKLQAGAVSTAKLAAGAVTAEKLAVAELSAITASLGKVTSGEIRLTNEEATLTLSKEGLVLPLEEAVPGGAGPKKLTGVRWRGKTEGLIEIFGEAQASPSLNARVAEGVEKSSTATLWEMGAKSSFLQLTAVAKRKVDFGQVEVEWTAKGAASAALKVAHGIGATPRVSATGEGFTGSFPEVANAGKETFEIRLVSTTGEIAAGTKRKVNWIAIG